MRIMRPILGSVPSVLIVLWTISGASPVLAQEKGRPPEQKSKADESKGKVGEAKKAAKAEGPASAAKESAAGAKEKAADQGKPSGKAASEAAGKVKENPLAQETAKHLKRMAQIDRLEKVARGQKSEKAQKKIAMLREKELRRHEGVLARLGREKGVKAVEQGKKKAEEGKIGKKTGKGE